MTYQLGEEQRDMHTLRCASRRLFLMLGTRFCNTNCGARPGIRNTLCRVLLTFFLIDRSYDALFSSVKIEENLIKQRVKLARKRHDKEFFYNINKKNTSPENVKLDEIEILFPPRRKWIHLNFESRKNKSPIDRNILSLKSTIKVFRKSKTKSIVWLINLDKRIGLIRNECSSFLQQEIVPPKILPIFKKEKGGINLFRPLAQYKINDSIRIGKGASYLRKKFDNIFFKNSYAFRDVSSDLKRCPTHHDAVDGIIKYRQKNIDKAIYVAECDIQKFFDIINHDVVIECFEKLKNELPRKNFIDCRAEQVLIEYLKSYNYESAIKGAEKFFLEHGVENADLDRPNKTDLASLYNGEVPQNYGVPQGGALSPIIANIVLHFADKKIVELYRGPKDDLFYARYCDDMVIMHTDKAVCEELFKAYCQALDELKLLIHEPEKIETYSSSFYKLKSRQTYEWNNPACNTGAVPWISFVGYQVRYDAKIRVRLDSINKEMEKQKKIASQTIKSIRVKGVVSHRGAKHITHRLRSKMYSMAVGRRRLDLGTTPALGMCWCSGFNLIRKNDFAKMQIKSLDRSREKQISIVKKLLSSHRIARKLNNEDDHRVKVHKHYGHPFSYYSGFSRDS